MSSTTLAWNRGGYKEAAMKNLSRRFTAIVRNGSVDKIIQGEDARLFLFKDGMHAILFRRVEPNHTQHANISGADYRMAKIGKKKTPYVVDLTKKVPTFIILNITHRGYTSGVR